MRRVRHPIVLGLIGALIAGCAGGGVAPVIESSTESAPTPVAAPPAAPIVAEPVEPPDAVAKPLRDQTTAGVELPAAELPAAELAEPEPAAAEPSAVEAANPAVVALLNTANEQSRAGRHDTAAASLERALQIEPRNAWLWHRLARARFAQGELEQAEQLAAKSNSFAADDRRLLVDNWLLIAEARRQRGDLPGALDAEIRAGQVDEGG